jgi:hypothetical protein
VSWSWFFQVVAVKLKNHRLKPGGVLVMVLPQAVAVKLKNHRLKPGGVLVMALSKALALKLKYHRLKAWWYRSQISKPHLASDAGCGSEWALNP